MVITLDFETYYDDEYTFSKMTTEEYVRDKRFEVHGAAIKWGPDGVTKWYLHEELIHMLPEICAQTDTTGLLCHHAQFDGFILSHAYKCKPPLWIDTYSMARMMIGAHIGKGLGSLAEHFGLGVKDI